MPIRIIAACDYPGCSAAEEVNHEGAMPSTWTLDRLSGLRCPEHPDPKVPR